MSFDLSLKMQSRFHLRIPGGAHTYAKGDDQYPEFMPPYITHGHGCHIWDADGNEYIEFGMGLRAVSLGHAFKPVVDSAIRQMMLGANFNRPSVLELETAEEFLSLIPGAEMVKFGKNGSDAVTAAVRLSRAYTRRDYIAICQEHPFFAGDDWFIGTTSMSSGVPKAVQALSLKFSYNHPVTLERLFREYPNRIACVVMEPEREVQPVNSFLQEVRRLCTKYGAVLIFDELICGFRWHIGGGQGYHGIEPDLSTFGKAMGNGFSISALAGKRCLMELGGFDHDHERVFLLSLTHGAETHCLAACLETIKTYEREPVIQSLWAQGERLQKGVDRIRTELHLGSHFELIGRPCNLIYTTHDHQNMPSQAFRTLFLQETLKRGVLCPSLVVSYSHTDQDIDRAIQVIGDALVIYRKALDEGVEKYLIGRPVKPAFRKYA